MENELVYTWEGYELALQSILRWVESGASLETLVRAITLVAKTALEA